MGACQSSQQQKKYLDEDDPGPESALSPLKNRDAIDPFSQSNLPDATEATEASDESTHHVALGSLLLTPSPILEPNKSPVSETTAPSFPNYSKNTRKGRALAARLEKARLRQMAASPTNFEGTPPGTEKVTDFLHEHEDNRDDSSGPTLRFTLSNETPKTKENEEFEKSLDNGMVWAEIKQEDEVLAVALSRQMPTLTMSHPPLLLAVGDQAGCVTVTQLLDDGPFAREEARLGATVTASCNGKVRAVDFSPDGRFLAAAGDDGICSVYALGLRKGRLERLMLVQEIQRQDRIYVVQFSPDGRLLALGGYDDTVAILSLPTPHQADLLTEVPTDGLVLSMDWSPDGHLLAIGTSDKRCSVVDTRDVNQWSIVSEIRRSSPIQTVQWHPRGHLLAVGAQNVAIVERESFKVRHEVDMNGKISPTTPKGNDMFRTMAQSRGERILHVCWSPNGGYLVVHSSDGQCKLLEAKSFSPVQNIQRDQRITGVVWGQHSVLTGVPRRYLAIGEENKVGILKAGIEVSEGTSTIGDDVSAASSYLSNRGEWVLRENTFRDMDDGGLVGMPTMQNSQQCGGSVHAVAFSRGSKSRPSAFFAVATGDGAVTIRSTLGWKVLARFDSLFPTACLAFSNGSRMLALGGQEGKVRIIATSPTWKTLTEVNAEDRVTCLAFSKNNERLVVGAVDGALIFYNPNDNFSVTGSCEENESAVRSVNWCTKYLAVGRQDGSLTIYESELLFKGHFTPLTFININKPLRAVSFGGNGKFLVAATQEGTVRVYSAVGNWALVHDLAAGFPISSLKWSPDGRLLALSGEQNQLKVMDTVFWAQVAGVPRMVAPPSSSSLPSVLSFSQDGRLLAIGCGKAGTRVMNTRTFDVVLNLQTWEKDSSEDSSDDRGSDQGSSSDTSSSSGFFTE